jgi:hypothetical protein
MLCTLQKHSRCVSAVPTAQASVNVVHCSATLMTLSGRWTDHGVACYKKTFSKTQSSNFVAHVALQMTTTTAQSEPPTG